MTLQEVLQVAQLGAQQGCTEALFTLGECCATQVTPGPPPYMQQLEVSANLALKPRWEENHVVGRAVAVFWAPAPVHATAPCTPSLSSKSASVSGSSWVMYPCCETQHKRVTCVWCTALQETSLSWCTPQQQLSCQAWGTAVHCSMWRQQRLLCCSRRGSYRTSMQASWTSSSCIGGPEPAA